MKKLSILVVVLFCLSGCELVASKVAPAPVLNITNLCDSQLTIDAFDDYCELSQWHDKLVEYSALSWPTRNSMINALADEPEELLQKILLSHGNDTPYTNRLRAQNWINSLQTVTDKAMTQLLDIMFFQPNQQLLELESAITILSQVNARQAKTMSAQTQLLKEKQDTIKIQKQQVEQLLAIEASLVNQGRKE